MAEGRRKRISITDFQGAEGPEDLASLKAAAAEFSGWMSGTEMVKRAAGRTTAQDLLARQRAARDHALTGLRSDAVRIAGRRLAPGARRVLPPGDEEMVSALNRIVELLSLEDQRAQEAEARAARVERWTAAAGLLSALTLLITIFAR